MIPQTYFKILDKSKNGTHFRVQTKKTAKLSIKSSFISLIDKVNKHSKSKALGRWEGGFKNKKKWNLKITEGTIDNFLIGIIWFKINVVQRINVAFDELYSINIFQKIYKIFEKTFWTKINDMKPFWRGVSWWRRNCQIFWLKRPITLTGVQYN